MKTVYTLVFCFFLIISLKADDNKYTSAMKKNLSKMDSAKTVRDFLDGANSFERIAKAEKNKWLPFYYSSFFYTIASFTDSASDKKDSYLDKSDEYLGIADSLSPNNSEIYTLKGMIAQARMSVDPMNRWMTYGNLAAENFNKAAELDSLNPRPDYLTGVGIFYMPEQFGGGPKAAQPYLEKSLAKFDLFVPEDEIMPKWGKQEVQSLLSQVKD